MGMISLGVAGVGGVGTFMAIRKTRLPIAAKAGISLAGAGVGYFVGRKIEKVAFPGGSEKNVGAAKTEAQEMLKNNAHLPPDQQVKASHTKQEFLNYANGLERAMKGTGTNDEAVKKIIAEAINNDLDFLLLVEQFGIRDDDDLSTWLDDDGATEEANAVLATKSMVSKRF